MTYVFFIPKCYIVKESHTRSLIKGVSWRIVGTLDTMLISYLITGSVRWAVSIGSVEVITKIILYYLHERCWQLIPKGSVKTRLNKQ